MSVAQTTSRPHDLRHPLPFDILGRAFKADPFPTFAAMRAAGEVIPLKLPFIGRAWVTTSYAATEEALKRNDLFVIEGRNAGETGIAGVRWLPKRLQLLASNMLGKDEPDHRRLRHLVDQAFSRRGIGQMRGRIEQLADRLLDELPVGPEIDLVTGYARRLPMEVICDLLGLPERDRGRFSQWAAKVGSISSILNLLLTMGSLNRMADYLRGQIEAGRMSDQPGLISELIRAEQEGDQLSEDELLSMIFLLLVAGFETTTHLISGSVVDLAANPEQKAFLLADLPGRTERAVEELARHVSSVQGTKPRFVAQDVDFHGQKLTRGEVIMPLIAAANADPAMFERPEALNLDRFPNPHLVFATGVHFCLGQQLARVEAQSALSRLYARYPNLTIGAAGPAYTDRLGTRSITALPVRLNAARARVAA